MHVCVLNGQDGVVSVAVSIVWPYGWTQDRRSTPALNVHFIGTDGHDEWTSAQPWLTTGYYFTCSAYLWSVGQAVSDSGSFDLSNYSCSLSLSITHRCRVGHFFVWSFTCHVCPLTVFVHLTSVQLCIFPSIHPSVRPSIHPHVHVPI